MMQVIFKNNIEPCIQHEVKSDEEVVEYDETLNKYCPMIEIELIGLVPKELLTQATHKDNVQAIDLAIYLRNK